MAIHTKCKQTIGTRKYESGCPGSGVDGCPVGHGGDLKVDCFEEHEPQPIKLSAEGINVTIYADKIVTSLKKYLEEF